MQPVSVSEHLGLSAVFAAALSLCACMGVGEHVLCLFMLARWNMNGSEQEVCSSRLGLEDTITTTCSEARLDWAMTVSQDHNLDALRSTQALAPHSLFTQVITSVRYLPFEAARNVDKLY